MMNDAKITVKHHREHTVVATTLPDSGRSADVTVWYHDYAWGADKHPAKVEVNWSALGSCSVVDAAAYASLLAMAAGIAAAKEHELALANHGCHDHLVLDGITGISWCSVCEQEVAPG